MSMTNASPADAARDAKAASHVLSTLPASARNEALTAIYAGLEGARDEILAANARDLEAARRQAADGAPLSQSLVSRLDLGRKGKFEDMLRGILDVRDLEDPGASEVIANIASLAVKSGNSAILKGGKESTESFKAISKVISEALAKTQVPNGAIQLVTTRDVIPQLLDLDQYIDLVIPRGGNELVRYIKSSTKIPVLGHANGLCSIRPTPKMAADVIVDSKTNYPAACNSLETLLVQESALDTLFPAAAEALLAKGVLLRCDPKSKAALAKASFASQHGDKIVDAKDADFETEFLALELAVKTVVGLEEAVAHINTHGSKHTDAILTSSPELAERFMNSVDAAGTYWNASTRMADGMRYGFGTEVGISTNKIHSRGPVGLEGLMIYKYKIRGRGQVAGAYGEGDGKKHFLHERLPL
ncbi:gamma-glutamyl phosphate reductase [Apiospora phragmitis]|uniref:glutamate-5-semialdehyde dehydrogenase n=1 Tax=Apiospora phragmitis TaxID=2905665 RepID=A0ABR1VFZ0_9PEZI